MIYGLYDDTANSGRVIKAEFEPVKAWSEIKSEYDPQGRIIQKGWVKLKAKVTADDESPFIPSIYGIEPLEVLSGPKEALEATRIYSYMEEFRQQAQKDEIVIVEGNLEEVESSTGSFRQVTLTYCPRYYEQVLKYYTDSNRRIRLVWVDCCNYVMVGMELQQQQQQLLFDSFRFGLLFRSNV